MIKARTAGWAFALAVGVVSISLIALIGTYVTLFILPVAAFLGLAIYYGFASGSRVGQLHRAANAVPVRNREGSRE